MKKIVSIIFVLLFLVRAGFAQGGDRRDRVEALRVAYITDGLELSVEESQRFWPIYNEMEEKRKKIKAEMKNSRDIQGMTESEADKFIRANFEKERAILDLKYSYYDKFKTVLSAKRLAKLPELERNFRKELLKRVKQRREGRGGFGN